MVKKGGEITMNILLPKTDVMLSSCKAIDDICSPLRKVGIIALSYTRVYDDHTFIDVSNHAAAIEEFYYGKNEFFKCYYPDIHPEILKGEFCFSSSVVLSDNLALVMLNKEFGMDNILAMVKRRQNYYEIYNFIAQKDNPGIINFYINNMGFLEKFIYYFRDRAKVLIEKYEKDRIIRVLDPPFENDKTTNNSENFKPEINLDFDVEHYYFNKKNDESHLTKREVDCLQWCIYGKSNAEIAIMLSISKRTVEAHLNNVKKKLDCYKQTDLVRKAIDLNIFDGL